MRGETSLIPNDTSLTKKQLLQFVANRKQIGKNKYNPIKNCVLCLYQIGFGCTVISKKTNTNKSLAAKWVRQAGIKQSGRKTKPGKCGDKRKTKQTGINHHLKEAFQEEWIGCKYWDGNNYWANSVITQRILAARRISEAKKQKTNYGISQYIRCRVYGVLKGGKKSAPTLKLLGCDIDFFRSYIAMQFKDGMDWANHGKFWHLDHIRPCASFDLSREAEQRRCFHYSNYQPLLAKENRKKNSMFNGKIIRKKRILPPYVKRTLLTLK